MVRGRKRKPGSAPPKPRKPLEPWAQEAQANLARLWREYEIRPDALTQSEFAETYLAKKDDPLENPQAVLWQYVNGIIPLNLWAAAGFARGLGCGLEQISPRLFAELGIISQGPVLSAAATRIGLEYDALPPPQKATIRSVMRDCVQAAEAAQAGARAANDGNGAGQPTKPGEVEPTTWQ